jgi:hypothetical protein
MWFQRSLTGIERHLVQVWYPDAKDSCSQKGTSATVVSHQRVPGNHHIKASMPDQEECGWRICGSLIRHIRDVYYLYQALEMIVHLYLIVLGHCSK